MKKVLLVGGGAREHAVTHRPDIGTAELIAKQVRHMEELRRK